MTQADRPLQISLAASLGVLLVFAIVFAIARMAGDRIVWGVLSVIGLAGFGIGVALLGGRYLGFSIAGGSAVALTFYTAAAMAGDDSSAKLLLLTFLLFWVAWAYFAKMGTQISRLLQIAAGLNWGFLVGVSILISFQNARVSVNWLLMIAALVLMPVLFFLPMLPIWAIRKCLQRRSAAQEKGPAA